ncbi:MAG: type VI secretion system lipoprotein TssJ [Xanthomonadaceae bacterium]|nr:type VI secretion system lipoprotein TssJ [Xanthomonadaceae bacterium]
MGTGIARAMIVATLVLALGGCASSGGSPSGGPLAKVLEAVGLRRAADAPKEIPVSLYAGANLNSGNDGQALAVVVRIYRLRQAQRFEQAPFSAFLDEASERAAFGDDLIGTTEIVLQPGQRHEITERLPADAEVLGIVALFRAPAQNRWRLAFDSAASVKKGITIGLHACALTSTSGSLITQLNEEPHSLATAKCIGE